MRSSYFATYIIGRIYIKYLTQYFKHCETTPQQLLIRLVLRVKRDHRLMKSSGTTSSTEEAQEIYCDIHEGLNGHHIAMDHEGFRSASKMQSNLSFILTFECSLLCQGFHALTEVLIEVRPWMSHKKEGRREGERKRKKYLDKLFLVRGSVAVMNLGTDMTRLRLPSLSENICHYGVPDLVTCVMSRF